MLLFVATRMASSFDKEVNKRIVTPVALTPSLTILFSYLLSYSLSDSFYSGSSSIMTQILAQKAILSKASFSLTIIFSRSCSILFLTSNRKIPVTPPPYNIMIAAELALSSMWTTLAGADATIRVSAKKRS
jgi:hypothetical protein